MSFPLNRLLYKGSSSKEVGVSQTRMFIGPQRKFEEKLPETPKDLFDPVSVTRKVDVQLKKYLITSTDNSLVEFLFVVSINSVKSVVERTII